MIDGGGGGVVVRTRRGGWSRMACAGGCHMHFAPQVPAGRPAAGPRTLRAKRDTLRVRLAPAVAHLRNSRGDRRTHGRRGLRLLLLLLPARPQLLRPRQRWVLRLWGRGRRGRLARCQCAAPWADGSCVHWRVCSGDGQQALLAVALAAGQVFFALARRQRRRGRCGPRLRKGNWLLAAAGHGLSRAALASCRYRGWLCCRRACRAVVAAAAWSGGAT